MIHRNGRCSKAEDRIADAGNSHGFLLDQGSYTTLNVPGSRYTVAHGINDSGQIVGYYWDGNIEHGFLFDRGNYTTLAVPGARYTWATGINASGQIVRHYWDGNGTKNHGFVPDQGNYTTLDVPGSTFNPKFSLTFWHYLHARSSLR
jgi:probable HAF family extracellular repeat protein